LYCIYNQCRVAALIDIERYGNAFCCDWLLIGGRFWMKPSYCEVLLLLDA